MIKFILNKIIPFTALLFHFTPLFADNEIYDGQDVSGKHFGSSCIDSSWVATTAIGTYFSQANLTNADFTDANLTKAFFYRAILTGANFTNAIIDNANLNTTGITNEQLYSTANYKRGDLSGVELGTNNWQGCDFSGQNMTNASLSSAVLTGANFTNTIIKGVDFDRAGLTKEQLYSTASYKNKDLSGVGFDRNNLESCDFSSQNLTNARFTESSLTNANFTSADLRGAYLNVLETGEFITKNTIMSDGVIKNFSMKSVSDRLVIREHVPAKYPEYGEYQISAKISEADSEISGGAQLSLEQGAKLEITNGKTLKLASDGKLLIQTDVNSSTTISIDPLAALNIEKGGEVFVDIVGELNANDYEALKLLEWDADSNVVGLSDLSKDETLFLTLNGEIYIGEWDYLIENNQFIITIGQVPEPAAYAAILGIFAIIFVYKKRKSFNG